MSDGDSFLFQTDIERFHQLVLNDNDKERIKAFANNIHDLALCEILRYGLRNDTAMIPRLQRPYREFMANMPEARCIGIYKHVVWFIENIPAVTVNALLPFIGEDPRRLIASSAVIDFVSLGRLVDGDPMTNVRAIIEMIGSGHLVNPGAAFGALLHIGDPRVCRLLLPLRDGLDKDVVNEATKCATGIIHSATVEFYLDWLEGMDGDDRDGLFGFVAGGLARLARSKGVDMVWTGYRPFPVTGASQEHWRQMGKPIPLSKYVPRIANRLRALERTEPPPRILPHVISYWGLTPVSAPSEIAVLDDRARLNVLAPGAPVNPPGVHDVENEWWDEAGQILIAWGILNPNGPTLCILGAREMGQHQRVYFRWLHMLGGCTTYAAANDGDLTYNRIFQDALAIHAHLLKRHEKGLFETCPSFLLIDFDDDKMESAARRLILRCSPEDMADGQADWGDHLAYQRQFGSDFFGRAGAQMRKVYNSAAAAAKAEGVPIKPAVEFLGSVYGDIPAFRDAKIPHSAPSPVTSGLLEEWWSTVSTRKFRVSALGQLKTMWEGSCSQMLETKFPDVIAWTQIERFLAAHSLPIVD